MSPEVTVLLLTLSLAATLFGLIVHGYFQSRLGWPLILLGLASFVGFFALAVLPVVKRPPPTKEARVALDQLASTQYALREMEAGHAEREMKFLGALVAIEMRARTSAVDLELAKEMRLKAEAANAELSARLSSNKNTADTRIQELETSLSLQEAAGTLNRELLAAELSARTELQAETALRIGQLEATLQEEVALSLRRGDKLRDYAALTMALRNRLRSRKASLPTTTEESAVPRSSREELRRLLVSRMSGPQYDLIIQATDELVKGRKGDYYEVVLKNSADGSAFRFASGSNSFEASDQQVGMAFRSFLDNAIRSLPSEITCELFVRGHADTRKFQKPPPSSSYEAFRETAYFKKLASNTYGNERELQRLGQWLQNEELPILRGAYLRKLITSIDIAAEQTCLHTLVVEVLAGDFYDPTDNRALRAELFLLVR